MSTVYVGPSRSMSTRLTVEPRVGRGRDHRHQVAVLGRADRRRRPFCHGLAGRHEDDLVEREPVGHLAGRHQVTVVDRVEGAAHDADPPGAVTRRGSLVGGHALHRRAGALASPLRPHVADQHHLDARAASARRTSSSASTTARRSTGHQVVAGEQRRGQLAGPRGDRVAGVRQASRPGSATHGGTPARRLRHLGEVALHVGRGQRRPARAARTRRALASTSRLDSVVSSMMTCQARALASASGQGGPAAGRPARSPVALRSAASSASISGAADRAEHRQPVDDPPAQVGVDRPARPARRSPSSQPRSRVDVDGGADQPAHRGELARAAGAASRRRSRVTRRRDPGQRGRPGRPASR